MIELTISVKSELFPYILALAQRDFEGDERKACEHLFLTGVLAQTSKDVAGSATEAKEKLGEPGLPVIRTY